MSQGEAMSENEATEGGVIFEELSTVRCYIVDGGSGSWSVAGGASWRRSHLFFSHLSRGKRAGRSLYNKSMHN